jgi:hypothetical protein
MGQAFGAISVLRSVVGEMVADDALARRNTT